MIFNTSLTIQQPNASPNFNSAISSDKDDLNNKVNQIQEQVKLNNPSEPSRVYPLKKRRIEPFNSTSSLNTDSQLDLSQVLEKKDNTIKDLEKEIENLKHDIEEVSEENKALSRENQAITQKYQKLRSENRALKTKKNNLRESQDTSTSIADAVKKRKRDDSREKTNWQQQVHALEAQLDEMRAHLIEREKEIDKDFKAEKDELNQKISGLNSQVSNFENKCRKYKQKYKGSHSTCKELELKCQKLSDALKMYQKRESIITANYQKSIPHARKSEIKKKDENTHQNSTNQSVASVNSTSSKVPYVFIDLNILPEGFDD